VIGLSVLLVILFLAVCWSAIDWRKCCEKTYTSCDRIVLYELVILEQQEEVLKDKWIEKAKKDLATKIQNILDPQPNETGNIERGHIAACCDAADELIEQLETQRRQVPSDQVGITSVHPLFTWRKPISEWKCN
ncbi:hypothetical protein ILYODFUR_037075, partial [Ilyodon furcidens]